MSVEKVDTGKMALGVLGAIIAASVGNAVLSLIAQALGASAEVIQGLQPQGYIFLTAVGIVIAAVAWSVIRTRSENPEALLRKLVPVVVGVSLLADVPLFLLDGASPIGVIALMLMHVLVAAVAVPIFAKVMPLPSVERRGVTA